MQGWAPGLVDAVVAMQVGPCWHQPCGHHHDGLWWLPPKGVVLGHWVVVLAGLGVQKPQATAMLPKVEATIAAALPGVWGRPRLGHSSSTGLWAGGWGSTHNRGACWQGLPMQARRWAYKGGATEPSGSHLDQGKLKRTTNPP